MPAFSKGRREEPQKLTKKSQKKKFMLQSIEMRRMPPQSAIAKNKNIRGNPRLKSQKESLFAVGQSRSCERRKKKDAWLRYLRRWKSLPQFTDEKMPNAERAPEDISHLDIFYKILSKQLRRELETKEAIEMK